MIRLDRTHKKRLQTVYEAFYFGEMRKFLKIGLAEVTADMPMTADNDTSADDVRM